MKGVLYCERNYSGNNYNLRPSSDAVLHMSRIECKWGRTKDFAHLHSIRLMWSTASELGLSLDINYSSRFVQYPHCPIACCLPRLSTVAHNCHSKSINLTAIKRRLTTKRITSRCGKKKNLTAKKENLTAKRKRLTAKFLRYREDIF